MIDLLRYFSVGTLLLPYLSPWDRLVVALDEGARSDSDLLAFLMAPTAFLLRLPGAEIGRIVLVPPSDGDPAAPMPAAPADDRPDEGRGAMDLKIDRGEAPRESEEAGGRDEGLDDGRVAVLAPGGALTIPNLWEFVPFNDPSRASHADAAFRSSAQAEADRLRQAQDDPERAAALDALKSVYESTFGSGAKNKNVISLFLYSGPLGEVRLVAAREECLRHRLLSWCLGIAPCGRDRDRFGQMLTGDGYLKTKKQFNDFLAFYHCHGRLERSAYFQVMHHGSKSNWHPGIARRVNPLASLFSSNPSGQYRHPHPEVLRDFSPYHPRQIDGRHGWRLRGHFAFL